MFFGIFKLRALTSKQSAKGARSTLRESFIGNFKKLTLFSIKSSWWFQAFFLELATVSAQQGMLFNNNWWMTFPRYPVVKWSSAAQFQLLKQRSPHWDRKQHHGFILSERGVLIFVKMCSWFWRQRSLFSQVKPFETYFFPKVGQNSVSPWRRVDLKLII